MTDEAARIAALERYHILDTPGEAAYDDITRVAVEVCGTPIALISFLDDSRQWFKSHFGLEAEQTPREYAFCDHAIRGGALMEVPDAREDPRFRDNPLVVDAPRIRYYAGVPLEMTSGHRLGTLCVIDREPRTLQPQQRAALEALGRQVVLQLELRRSLLETEQAHAELARESARREEQVRARARAERFMRDVVDVLPDSIAIVDGSGTIVRVNHAWRQFASANAFPGRLDELVEGSSYLEACRRAARTGNRNAVEVTDILERVLAGENVSDFSLEYPCHTPRQKRWFVVRIAAFSIGADRYAVLSHHDITARVFAEREVMRINKSLEARVEARTRELVDAHDSLHASEARFGSMFNNATAAFATANRQGLVLDANPAFLELYGDGRDAVVGRDIREFVHPDDQAAMSRLRSGMLEHAVPGYVRELRFVRADGDIRWVHISVAAIRDANREIIQTMALLHDITPTKIAEYERDGFFELSADMFAILDFSGVVQRINPACARLLGFEQDELSGRQYLELLHPDDRDEANRRLSNLARGNRNETDFVDVRVLNRAGEYREIRWSAAPWLDAGRMLVVGRDMTQVRDNERRLRALAARLQGIREEERTKISREIHDELGQLLTALKMDLSLFTQDAAGSVDPAHREPIERELRSMISLVDSTLESVRRIAQDLRPEVLDALGLIPAIRWQVRELDQRSTLRFSIDAVEDLPALDARTSTEVFRIVQEALTNVLKHARAREVTVSVTRGEESIEISVRDDGVGFDPEHQGGLSLGVLGMGERAASIGAGFDIASRPGEGATVTVSVPLGDGASPVAP